MGKPLIEWTDAEWEAACSRESRRPAAEPDRAEPRWSLEILPATLPRRPGPDYRDRPVAEIDRADRRVRSYRRMDLLARAEIRTMGELESAVSRFFWLGDCPYGLTHWDMSAFNRVLRRYRARFVDPPPPRPERRPARRPDLAGQSLFQWAS